MNTVFRVFSIAMCLGTSPFAHSDEDMILIPEGNYTPLYVTKSEKGEVFVPAFKIDPHAVTNGEFLEFVLENPRWQRSKIKRLFADEGYLRHWNGDTDLGAEAEILKSLPVTNISWFAARAYADWKGKRLPNYAEWERVALASETNADGRDEEGFRQRILEWYGKPNQPYAKWRPEAFRNVYGVYGMHGVIWEWVEDFNTALVTGESRGDASIERALFCGSGSVGASDFKDYAAFMRFGFRSSLEAKYAVSNLGFRCAMDAD